MKKYNNCLGFSLLEVMIALAIMGLSLTNLFESQARSMRLAAKGRSLTIATQLARKQLVECKADLIKKGFTIGDYENEGDFAEDGYKDYKYECHGLRFNMPPPSDEAIQKAIKSQTADPSKIGMDMSMGANMLAPFFGLVSNTLGDSIRELVVIIRWEEGGVKEDLKVVTHVVDNKPIADLANMLPDDMLGGLAGGPPGGSK